MKQSADCSNEHILHFCLKLITEEYSVSRNLDLELHSGRYPSILVQNVQILLKKTFLLGLQVFFMLSTVLCVHVNMQHMLTTGSRV